MGGNGPDIRSEVIRVACALGLGEANAVELDLVSGPSVYTTSFAVEDFAQVTIALSAVAAAVLWHRRGGGLQSVLVDRRQAAAAFRSDCILKRRGVPLVDPWHQLSGAYCCVGDRWIRVHANYPHHLRGLVEACGGSDTREGVAAFLQRADASEAAKVIMASGGIAAPARTLDEWQRTLHAKSIANTAEIAFEALGQAQALPVPTFDAPLSGIRVLDLTRVIAGPISTRVLAEHGADVLSVFAPHLPSSPELRADTDRGKRWCALDARLWADRSALLELAASADVVVQSYAPGVLDRLGLGSEFFEKRNPGAVVVSLSAYGAPGPLQLDKGFDSIVQAACGLNVAEGEALGLSEPTPLPCQALDYGSGYMMAAAAMTGLAARIKNRRGSHFHLSLARSSLWLKSLGRRKVEAPFEPDLAFAQSAIEDETSGTVFSRHPAHLSITQPTSFPSARGQAEPGWLERT